MEGIAVQEQATQSAVQFRQHASPVWIGGLRRCDVLHDVLVYRLRKSAGKAVAQNFVLNGCWGVP
jgi:hypothetical protein